MDKSFIFVLEGVCEQLQSDPPVDDFFQRRHIYFLAQNTSLCFEDSPPFVFRTSINDLFHTNTWKQTII